MEPWTAPVDSDPSQPGCCVTARSAWAGSALAEVLAAVALAPAAGYSWSEALTTFLATNGLMGASFALSGLLIAWHRPRPALGLVAGGGRPRPRHELSDAAAGAAAARQQRPFVCGKGRSPLSSCSRGRGPSRCSSRSCYSSSPTVTCPGRVGGTSPGPSWSPRRCSSLRWAPARIRCRTGCPRGTAVSAGTRPGLAVDHLRDEGRGRLAPGSGRASRAVPEGVRNGRRQLLWLLLAGLVVVVAVAPWSFVAGTPIAVLFAIPLVPLAICVAVIRHQLLDIRLVVSRAVAWLLLSVMAVAAYGAVVYLLGSFVSTALGRSALPTVLVAIALAPLSAPSATRGGPVDVRGPTRSGARRQSAR